MEGVKEAARKLANGKALGTNNLRGEPLELGRTENSATLKCPHNIVLTLGRQEVVPQEWKDFAIKMLCMKNNLTNAAITAANRLSSTLERWFSR